MTGIITQRNILDMQVCVPKSWDDDQVTSFANTENPCGTSNGWNIRKAGSEVLRGADERVQCSNDDQRVHIMLDA